MTEKEQKMYQLSQEVESFLLSTYVKYNDNGIHIKNTYPLLGCYLNNNERDERINLLYNLMRFNDINKATKELVEIAEEIGDNEIIPAFVESIKFHAMSYPRYSIYIKNFECELSKYPLVIFEAKEEFLKSLHDCLYLNPEKTVSLSTLPTKNKPVDRLNFLIESDDENNPIIEIREEVFFHKPKNEQPAADDFTFEELDFIDQILSPTAQILIASDYIDILDNREKELEWKIDFHQYIDPAEKNKDLQLALELNKKQQEIVNYLENLEEQCLTR